MKGYLIVEDDLNLLSYDCGYSNARQFRHHLSDSPRCRLCDEPKE